MRLLLVRMSLAGLTAVLAVIIAESARGQAPRSTEYGQGFTPNPYYTRPTATIAETLPIAEPQQSRYAAPASAIPSPHRAAPPGQMPPLAPPDLLPPPETHPPPESLPPRERLPPPGLSAPSARPTPLSGPREPGASGPPLAGSQETLEERLHAASIQPDPLPMDATRSWWAAPWAWIPADGWNNSIEFGINGTEGNSQTFSFLAGADVTRKSEFHELALDFNYARTSASGRETQNNAFFGADYDRLLGKSRWSAFTKLGLEYDRFKAFDLRLNSNSGFGYYWLRNDTSTIVTRFGAGASREFDGPNEEWSPEGMLGLEVKEQISESQRISSKLEYFPEWGDFGDFRLVTDVAYEVLLGNSENMSLKLAATDRIDSTPEGRNPNDINYSLMLLYKF